MTLIRYISAPPCLAVLFHFHCFVYAQAELKSGQTYCTVAVRAKLITAASLLTFILISCLMHGKFDICHNEYLGQKFGFTVWKQANIDVVAFIYSLWSHNLDTACFVLTVSAKELIITIFTDIAITFDKKY